MKSDSKAAVHTDASGGAHESHVNRVSCVWAQRHLSHFQLPTFVLTRVRGLLNHSVQRKTEKVSLNNKVTKETR